MTTIADAASSDLETRTLRRVRARLVPFLCLLYFFAYLNRVNIGFASLQMNDALGISASAYGFGAGVFFFGYFLFEVPSNVVLLRVGARRWIARILMTWGIVSVGMAATAGPKSFWALRFLLGAAEAGFFPGALFYFTEWFPARHRAGVVAQFSTASMFAGMFGAPVSGLLLGMRGISGLDGWQWLFVVEGLPSILLGFVVLAYLTDRPADAEWLPADEKAWLVEELRRENGGGARHHVTLGAALADRGVWFLASAFFLVIVAGYGFNFWVPQIVRGLSHGSDRAVGFLTAIPYALAALAMIATAAHSDRTGERRKHVAAAAFTATIGYTAIVAASGRPALAFAALCVAAMGTFSMTPPFWSLPTAFLRGPAAAAGIAFINAVGNLGGFAGPYVVGFLKEMTGDFRAGMLALGVAPAIAALMLLFGRRREAA